jgi:UDP-N-acetylglucosamine 2-epimerase (non-hydrolysing)
LPPPDIELDVGSGESGFQTGEMIKKLEKVFLDSKFEIVLVYGDTNSTFAGAFAASRASLKIGHIEAGLRSFDRSMPEEINRILTDHISDQLFAPTYTAMKNLQSEHVSGKVLYTGDLSVEIIKEAVNLASKSSILDNLELEAKSTCYLRCTELRTQITKINGIHYTCIRDSFHRGIDMRMVSLCILTTNKLKITGQYERMENCENVILLEPVGYVDL